MPISSKYFDFDWIKIIRTKVKVYTYGKSYIYALSLLISYCMNIYWNLTIYFTLFYFLQFSRGAFFLAIPNNLSENGGSVSFPCGKEPLTSNFQN